MSATHRQVLKLRLPRFPGQTAAQRMVDGSTTEQTTSDRPPEATGGCLLRREPTLKSEKEPLSLPRIAVRFQNDADRKMKLIRAL